MGSSSRASTASQLAFVRHSGPEAQEVLQHLQSAIWQKQFEDGHWHYPLDDNMTMNAEYIFFLYWMDEETDPLVGRLAQSMLERQQEDGSWNLFGGGPGNLSTTIEVYVALRIAGYEISHPAMQRAREFILSQGGIPKSRVFTKIWLALLELFPWEGIPMIPPEIMLSPRGTPFNIYEFSYWSRTVIIPLTILFHIQRTKKTSFDLDELYVHPEDKKDLSIPEPVRVDESWIIRKKLWDLPWVKWDSFFYALNQGVILYESVMPVKPLRAKALKMAKKWILRHQDESGDWGGIVPAMMNSVMALYALGHSKDEAPLAKGMQALKRLTRGESKSIRPHDYDLNEGATLQSCVSPIWDSALAALGLLESGVSPTDPRLQKTKEWLWQNRITRRSDWAFKAKLKAHEEIAAWCFQYHNAHFPDLDDSTVATLVLHRLGMTKEELRPAIRWLFCMQNSDGGWGTFDRDNNQWILNEIPFADLKSLIDPSNPDVTGHVLETLGELGLAQTKEVKMAVQYLKQVQRPDGSWFGRWGVHTIYGTCAAVVGMRKVGESTESPAIQRAIQFMLSRQNPDGGWGESCDCYHPESETGRGKSTPSQTAWALMALEACQTEQEDFAEVIQRAVWFLRSRIQRDGLLEPEFTGTGFPLHFYLRYDGYRNYFPLIALGRLQKQIGNTPHTTNS